MRDWLVAKTTSAFEAIRGLPERHEKQVLRGNPLVGKVYHLRLVHPTDATTREQNNAITLFQMRLFQELSQGNYDAVSIESLPTGWELVVKQHAREVQTAFYKYNQGSISTEQRRLFLEHGAAIIYCLLHPEVTPIPGTSYAANMQSEIGMHGNTARVRAEARISRLYVRERVAARNIRTYLDEHPGAQVALCYGGAHNFGFDFQRDLPREGFLYKQFGQRKKDDRPEVYEVDFPHEYKKVGLRSRANRELERMQRRKEKREPFIQSIVERLERKHAGMDEYFEEQVQAKLGRQ